MNVLITGGCGFIGKNLAHYMNNKLHNVSVMDNLSVGNPKNMPKIPIYQRDVCNLIDCVDMTKGMDCVVHLAAFTGIEASKEDPELCWKTNVDSTRNILEASYLNDVSRVILISSGAAKNRFDSTYALSKWTTEQLAYLYRARKYAVCLRLSNVYGKYSAHKTSLVAATIKAMRDKYPMVVYGDGSHERDFIYVDDVCYAIELAATSKKIKYNGNGKTIDILNAASTFEIGTGIGTSVTDIIGMLLDITNEHVMIDVQDERNEQKQIIMDIKKARDALKFEMSIPLQIGLRMTWESYK